MIGLLASDVTIPTEYVVAVLPIALVMLVGLLTWAVRELGRIQIISAAQGRDINAQHDIQVAQSTALMAQAATITQNSLDIAVQRQATTGLERRLKVVEDAA